MRRYFNAKKIRISGMLICIALILCVSLQVTAASWSSLINPSADTGLQLPIGSWKFDPPALGDFDDVVAQIIAADPLLQENITRIHVLGVNTGENTPDIDIAVNPYDVLVWQRPSGAIIVAQATGALPGSVFESFDRLEYALGSAEYALTGQGSTFSPGYVYTTAHAPVHLGGQRFLARHNNVTSVPSIGDDWFLISDSWVDQAYPVGSFVLHNGRRWRKISENNAEPGRNDEIWAEVPRYEGVDDVPLWHSTSWSAGSIVRFEDRFYISTIDDNQNTPGEQNSGWTVIPRFNPASNVPEYNENTSYNRGDFVRVSSENGDLYFVKMVTFDAPHPVGDTSGGWLIIHNWNDLTGAQTWSPYILYGNDYVGLVVRHNGQFFQKQPGWAFRGVEPQLQGQVWRRVLKWDESLGPVEYSAGNHEAGRIFKLTEDNGVRYFASIQETFGWFDQPIDSENQFFRPVQEWNPETEYSVLGYDVWTDGRLYHAYTLDDEGNRTFWVLRNSPTGTFGTVTGDTPGANPNDFIDDDSESPFWQKVCFANRESIVITEEDGNFVIWDRNPNIPIDAEAPIREPSNAHDDWIRRVITVSERYVRTGDNGEVTLWHRTSLTATSQEPGFGNDWTMVTFNTGLEYAYTINRAGRISFWHSPTQSSTRPGAEGWIRLNPPQSDIADYVYVVGEDGTVEYFATNRGYTWMELSNAWIGGGSEMQSHWNANNVYDNGDVVVYGITRTNTYRYFRMRPGVDAARATGISPMSARGRQFWAPISVFDW